MSAPARHRMENRIELVMEPMVGAKSVVVAFRFTCGAKDEPADRLGTARIAEDTAFKGTPSRDARDIYNAFDGMGIRRGSATSVENTDFQAQMLTRNFSDALKLYSEIFRAASFPDDQVEISKALALEELKRLEDNPIQKVLYLTYTTALGDPMGRIPLGDAESVPKITPAGIRNFWGVGCAPQRLLISVAGGMALGDMVDSVEEAFSDWAPGDDYTEDTHDISVAARSVHEEKESEQEHIGLLFGAAPRGHHLYYPCQLAVGVLSGSGSSRLFTEVREKRGLVYNVSAFYRARKRGGLIALYAGTTADRADETLKVCIDEVNRLGQDVTEGELERAKTVLKGRLFTTGDLPEGRAGNMMEDLFLEGTAKSVDEIAEGIDSVKLDQIGEYIEAFPPNPLTIATLGPRPLEIPQ